MWVVAGVKHRMLRRNGLAATFETAIVGLVHLAGSEQCRFGFEFESRCRLLERTMTGQADLHQVTIMVGDGSGLAGLCGDVICLGNSHCQGPLSNGRQDGASLLSTVPNYDYLNKTFSRSDSRHYTFTPTLRPTVVGMHGVGTSLDLQSRAEAGLRSPTVAEGHFLSRLAGLIDLQKKRHEKAPTDCSKDRILQKRSRRPIRAFRHSLNLYAPTPRSP